MSITLSMHDHAPFARAFGQLDELVFIDLVEDAARYCDLFRWIDEEAADAGSRSGVAVARNTCGGTGSSLN
jgi:hypothetical protein